MVSAHQDVLGEKELRDFLITEGWGDRKAYWVSSLWDYKGPRSCTEQSKFLAECKSIEVYVQEDGRDSIRLAAAFVPLGVGSSSPVRRRGPRTSRHRPPAKRQRVEDSTHAARTEGGKGGEGGDGVEEVESLQWRVSWTAWTASTTR